MRNRGSSGSSTSPASRLHLTKGSTVEVTSDEDGFRGVWFEATVLTSTTYSASRKKKVFVEYRTILADGDGSGPLRESVSLCFVRPVPPRIETRGFELYDVVDAFYKDGWWTGVVTKVLEEARYLVTFRSPPDELVFGLSDLRFHQQWSQGNWTRPDKQKTDSLMFSVGKEVQVSFDQDKYRDAWFPATILEDHGNGSFLVEYQCPVRDDVSSLEKVTVDFSHIRPCPPDVTNSKFNLLEKVDAFFDCAWWCGIITKELAGSRYNIFFKSTNREKELDDFNLRPHLDWKEGRWVTTSQDVSIPSDCRPNGIGTDASILQKDVPLGISSSPNEISDERTRGSVKHTEDLVIPSNVEVSPVELLQNAPTSCDAASSQSHELPKEPETPKMSLVACKSGEKPSEAPPTKSSCDNPSPNSEFDRRVISPVSGEKLPGKLHRKKRTRKRSLELGEDKGGKPEQFHDPNSPTRGSRHMPIQISAGNIEKRSKPKRSTRKEIEVPVIIGLECNKIKSSKGKRSRRVLDESLETIGEQKLTDTAIDSKQETMHSADLESTPKRKRGRPSRTSISTPTVVEPNGDHLVNEISEHVELSIMVNENGKEQHEVQIGHNESGRMRKKALTKLSNEKAVQSSFQQNVKHFVKKGKRQPKVANIESLAQGSADGSGVENTESNRTRSDGEEPLDEVPTNGFDDQPLAKWFEEMQSPTAIDGLRVSPACSSNPCGELREKEDVPAQSCVNLNPTTQTNPTLPFAKNTLLWATIESMDVFQKIPQKPHFRPLEDCSESSREGLAIGYMVTFSTIIEKASRLRYDDPRNKIEEILVILLDLEKHGFDVQLVRDRLTELLLRKDKLEKLEAQFADIDNQVVNHRADQKDIDEKIEEIKNKIAELQDQLSLAISRKEAKDREVDALRSVLEGIQADMKNTLDEFEGFASRPLTAANIN